jgi:CheY-like chemotaxis protein
MGEHLCAAWRHHFMPLSTQPLLIGSSAPAAGSVHRASVPLRTGAAVRVRLHDASRPPGSAGHVRNDLGRIAKRRAFEEREFLHDPMRAVSYGKRRTKPTTTAGFANVSDGGQLPPSAGVNATPAQHDRLTSRLNAHILVVEDNAVHQEVIGQMLRAPGCRVQVSSGAMHGLHAMHAAPVDPALMDIEVPGMGGVPAEGAWALGSMGTCPNRFAKANCLPC